MVPRAEKFLKSIYSIFIHCHTSPKRVRRWLSSVLGFFYFFGYHYNLSSCVISSQKQMTKTKCLTGWEIWSIFHLDACGGIATIFTLLYGDATAVEFQKQSWFKSNSTYLQIQLYFCLGEHTQATIHFKRL